MANIYRTVGQKDILKEANKMLKHFDDFNFLNIHDKKSMLSFNGENVKQNIYNEWLISNLVNCDEPSFLSSSLDGNTDVFKNFKAMKFITKQLPCSIVGHSVVNGPESEELTSNGMEILKSFFKRKNGMILKRYLFHDVNDAGNYFHKLQRARHLWWKKFSASPGRFILSEVFSYEEGQFVEVQAEFPWGSETVETIKSLPKAWQEDQTKSGSPSIVASETLLQKASLTFLCDGHESMEETNRNFLRLHRKLAPYKVNFAAVASTPNDERNLKDLALLLTKQIRKISISVLLLDDMCKTPIEEQIMRNDALGIPYTIVMDEKTLKSGLLGIRSRDTTLQEQSHVGLLVPYVEKLMKNY